MQLLRPLWSIRAYFLIIVLLLSIVVFIYGSNLGSIQGTNDSSPESKKQNITLTALLEDQGDPTRWKSLIEPAMEKLMGRYLLMWLLGVPIPILVLIFAFGGLN